MDGASPRGFQASDRLDEEYSFVADARTTRALARNAVGYLFRQRRARIVFGASYLALAVVFALGHYRGHISAAGRVEAGLVWGLVSTGFVAALAAVVLHRSVLYSARLHLVDGAVTRSGFGPDAFVYGNESSTHWYRYAAIRRVTVVGEFVVVKMSRRQYVWLPRSLLPDSAIDRIRQGRATPVG